jgi:hypothetical protein
VFGVQDWSIACTCMVVTGTATFQILHCRPVQTKVGDCRPLFMIK